MSNTYSMKELTGKWNCTKQGAEKKIKKYQIKTVPITFYGVSQDGYIVPDDLLESVKKEIADNKIKYFKTQKPENVIETEEEYIETDFETLGENPKTNNTQENMQMFFSNFTNIMETVSVTHKEHLRDVKQMFEERLTEKTKLLTTFETTDKNKDDEIIELRVRNKHLEEKNSMLDQKVSMLEEENKKLKEFRLFGIKIK